MAGSSAARKSTNILELKGSFKHNPDRAKSRSKEPKVKEGIGKPPPGLDPLELECWIELAYVGPQNILTVVDRPIVEHGARVMAKLRRLEVYDDYKAMSQLMNVLARLGKTPADRSRVQVTDYDDEKTAHDEFNS